MIAQIIPIIRLPAKSTFFDYQIPADYEKSIKKGCLVTIPFRNKKIHGLVYKVKTKSSVKKLKEIVKVDSDVLVRDYHFDLMIWFSDYYSVSWSTYFYTFLPLPIKKKTDKIINYSPPRPTLPPPQIKNSDNFDTKTKVNTLYLFDNYIQEVVFLQNLIKQTEQLAIFFPTVENLSSFYHSLSEKLKNNILIFTGELNKTQYWYLWNELLRKKNFLLLATRLGSFLPFNKETKIVLSQSESINFKQTDQNPRYSSSAVLQKIYELGAIKKPIIFNSYWPKLEHYTNAKIGRWDFVNNQQPIKNITFLDLNSVNYKHSYLLHEELWRKIKNKKRILFYLNRKGDFTVYKCSACQYIHQCPKCDYTLKFYQKQNLLKCHYCLFQPPPSETCPRCQSVDFKGVGSGIGNIKNILTKSLPDWQIVSLDSTTLNYQIFEKTNKPLAIVATDSILHKLNGFKFDQLVFLNADLDLHAFDFRANEFILQKYTSLIRLANTDTIIQTHNLDNNIWQILKSNYDYFWKQELATRKKYQYPPFVKLVKIIYAHPEKSLVEKNINDFYKNLIKNEKSFVSASATILPYKKHRLNYGFILIKYKSGIEKILSKLSKDWIIDHDPETI